MSNEELYQSYSTAVSQITEGDTQICQNNYKHNLKDINASLKADKLNEFKESRYKNK